jgi:hypothetical protein
MLSLLSVIVIAYVPWIADAQQPKSGTVLTANDVGRQLAPPPIYDLPPNRKHGKGTYFAQSHNFRGHGYHGKLAWKQGRWHQTTRKGRFGWWWDVGGVWYYYSEPIDGPPDYVSNIEFAAEAEGGSAAPPPPPVPEKPHQTFYYRPGDLTGVPYGTIEECSRARQTTGNVGVCVFK